MPLSCTGGFEEIQGRPLFCTLRRNDDHTLNDYGGFRRGVAVKQKLLRHNSAGIYLPKKALAVNRPPSAYEQALSWLVHKTYKDAY